MASSSHAHVASSFAICQCSHSALGIAVLCASVPGGLVRFLCSSVRRRGNSSLEGVVPSSVYDHFILGVAFVSLEVRVLSVLPVCPRCGFSRRDALVLEGELLTGCGPCSLEGRLHVESELSFTYLHV